jgi:hypothetical protein
MNRHKRTQRQQRDPNERPAVIGLSATSSWRQTAKLEYDLRFKSLLRRELERISKLQRRQEPTAKWTYRHELLDLILNNLVAKRAYFADLV